MPDPHANAAEDYADMLSAQSNKHTPGPWELAKDDWWVYSRATGKIVVAEVDTENEADYHLIAAATELLEAAQALEAAEIGRQDCEECEGEGEPEACGICFPAFDDARIKRRLAIAKAKGCPMPSTHESKS